MVFNRPRLPRRPTPLGIHPLVLLCLYFATIACAAKFIGNGVAIQRLLLQTGAYSTMHHPIQRETRIKAVAGVGMSATVLSGMIIGMYLSAVGPKVCVLTGLACNAIGLTLLFLLREQRLYMLGAILCGSAYQAIVNGLFGISILFPNNTALVLAMLGAGGDLSLSISVILLAISSFFRVAANTVVLCYTVIILGLFSIVSICIVPFRPFTRVTLTGVILHKAGQYGQNASTATVGETQPLVPNDHLNENGENDEFETSSIQPDPRMVIRKSRGTIPGFEALKGDISDNDDCLVAPAEPILWSYSCKKQFTTVQFWAFLPFFILHYCRYKHMMINARSLFIEIAHGNVEQGSYYANIFSAVIPFGFLVALGWGQLVDMIGVLPAIVALNSIGTVLTFLGYLGIHGTEYFIIVFFLIQSAYTLGIGFSYSSVTFGKNFSTIQGVISTTAGLASLLLDAYWNRYIIEVLQSQRIANLLVTFIGLAMYVFPLAIWLAQRSLPAKNTSVEGFDLEPTRSYSEFQFSQTEPHSAPVLYSDTQCYDVRSIDELDRSSRQTLQESQLKKSSLAQHNKLTTVATS